MAETYDLETVNYLNLEDIRSVIDRASGAFKDVALQNKEDNHRLYLDGLSKEEILTFPKICGLKDLDLKGRLPTKSLPWGEFKQVLENIDDRVKQFGACFLSVGYEEKNTKQSKSGYDAVDLSVDKGVFNFIYYANGSKVCTDNEYAKSTIKGLIDRLELSITVEEGDGFYKLVPQKGELKILAHGGLFGKNPRAFRYEISESDPENLIAMLKAAYEFLASGKVFECSWRCFPRLSEDNPYRNDLFSFFDIIRQQDLPADSYDLDLDVKVKELADLDVLQSLCRGKDAMFTRLISFDIDEDNYAEIDVKTTKEGHKLQLSMRIGENVDQVTEALGVAFKEL